MQKNKILLFSFYCLVGALIFISCQKDNSIVEEQKIEEPVVETPNIENIEEQAIIGVVVLKDIFMIIFQQSLLQPDLWGFVGEQSAVVRDVCPDTDGTTSSGTLGMGGTYDLLLDFAAGCMPAGTLPILMEGTIEAAFTDVMFGAPDVPVTISSGFKIGNYTITSSNNGDIDLLLSKQGSGNTYRFKSAVPADNIIFTNCTTGDMTVYTGDSNFGNFRLSDGPVANDPTNPVTYIDDQIEIRVATVEVECITAGGTSVGKFDLDVPGNRRLIVNPFECGCITDGTMTITGQGSAPSSTLDFGVDASGAQSGGACNGSVEVDDGTTTTVEPLQSCT